LKKVIILILSVLAAIGIALAATVVQAHGGLDTQFSSKPRFPIAGQTAELTFIISSNGTPEKGQEPMVMLAWTASGAHTHGEAAAPVSNTTPAGGSMAGMDMGGTPATAEAPPEIMLMPVETSPGVYVANTTFTQGGRYLATVSIGDEEADIVIGVRSSAVAWGYVGMLAGLIIALAVAVAVVKTVRRTW
jgi:hypothetical protein